MQMHPVFWPMQAMVFWLDVLMLPWKEAAAAASPAATAALDPVSPNEIGTSATDFRKAEALH